jgi:hypothetical protein
MLLTCTLRTSPDLSNVFWDMTLSRVASVQPLSISNADLAINRERTNTRDPSPPDWFVLGPDDEGVNHIRNRMLMRIMKGQK